MTERLIETLRDGGNLALTTDEAESKATALADADFLVVDLEKLPQPEWTESGRYNHRFVVGSVDIKRNWKDGEDAATYARRQMDLARDHIAAAKYVLENPPPKPPQYREERRLLLGWQESATRFPEPDAHYGAYYDLLEKATKGDAPQGVQLLDVVQVEDGYRHLYGMTVTRKVLIEEEAA